IPLTGIWTLPLISKNLLPLLNEKHSAVLLVSQQVSSNLRQTFFRDGKMLSSRQSVINLDEKDSGSIGEYAAPEVERTVTFLRNQRLIDANEIVHLHVIGSQHQMASLDNAFKTNALNKITIHTITDLQSKAGLTGLSGKFADGLFTSLCAKQNALQAHYGKAKEYSQYYYLLASKILKAVSLMLALSALLITESNLSSAIEHEHSKDLLSEQSKKFESIYKNDFEQYEAVYDHARLTKSAVELSDRIYKHGKTSPLDFMIELSNILSQQGLGVDRIDKIEWSAQQYNDAVDGQQVKTGSLDVTIENPVRHIGIVHGRIAVSDKDYRGSVSQVNRIVAALSQHKRIKNVEAIEMPVEVRPEKAFTDESGLSVNDVTRKDTGKFALKVIMKEVGDE
ncbi:MAG: hypothetical protein OEY06_11360, partial [Gammaproteobacteria bacterium]|nr:hypothetical protein [Gammaproteobacteria bacterium]